MLFCYPFPLLGDVRQGLHPAQLLGPDQVAANDCSRSSYPAPAMHRGLNDYVPDPPTQPRVLAGLARLN